MIVGKKITIFYISGNANYEQHVNKTIYNNNTNNNSGNDNINKLTVKIIIIIITTTTTTTTTTTNTTPQWIRTQTHLTINRVTIPLSYQNMLNICRQYSTNK
jgi:hypothetical protein